MRPESTVDAEVAELVQQAEDRLLEAVARSVAERGCSFESALIAHVCSLAIEWPAVLEILIEKWNREREAMGLELDAEKQTARWSV